MNRPRLLALAGWLLVAACSSPPTVEDAGQPDAGGADAGDGGSAVDGGDAGEPDAGFDAGCVGTVAAQVVFASAPRTLDARACSPPLTAQLQTACGVPVVTPVDLPVAFSATGPTTEIFGDGTCLGRPSVFVIPAGSSSLEVFFRDVAPGTSSITVTAAGLDAGSQLETFVCAAGEKPCSGTSCIPTADCCLNADCASPKVCNALGKCAVPPCPGIVNSCGTFLNYDGGLIAIAAPFNPRCVRTVFNGSVKFTNAGIIHPLEQHCGPADVAVSTFSPTATVTGLSAFGTYGFRCAAHPVFEVGAVRVP